MRIITCAAALLLAYADYHHAQRLTNWAVALTVIAIVFNPIFTVHLTRSLWSVLNLGAAGLLVAHLVVVRGDDAPRA